MPEALGVDLLLIPWADLRSLVPMKIYLNGEPQDLAHGSSVAALVQDMGLGGQRIAVEVNQEIVPRSEYVDHHLQEGDRVEVVRAIGGG